MLLPNVVFPERLFLHTIDVHVVTCCFLSVSSLLYNKLNRIVDLCSELLHITSYGNALQASILK
jgi:hypothetical protein